MLILLRSGEGALLEAYKKIKDIFKFQPCHGRLILPGSELWIGVPPCSELSMVKRC